LRSIGTKILGYGSLDFFKRLSIIKTDFMIQVGMSLTFGTILASWRFTKHLPMDQSLSVGRLIGAFLLVKRAHFVERLEFFKAPVKVYF